MFQRVVLNTTGGMANQAVGKMAETDERQRFGVLPRPGDRGDALVSALRAVLQGLSFLFTLVDNIKPP